MARNYMILDKLGPLDVVLIRSSPNAVCPPCSDMREHLAHESASIRMAREFLMRQKQTLRQRQTLLRTAQQQWSQDMLRHQLGVSGSERNGAGRIF